MLTPVFAITQDHSHLFITITAPNTRLSESEIHFEDTDFRFYSKPYYLRLDLPSKVVENGEESIEYDSTTGKFLIKLSKASPGEHFEGLDLLTKLLSTNDNHKSKRPLIEVIGGNDCSPEEISEDFEWNLDQEVRKESDELSLKGENYGFADKYSGVMARVTNEFYDLIDLKDAEHKSPSQRRKERIESESKDFSDDHYLFDKFEQNELISKIIAFQLLPNYHNEDYEFDDDMRFRLKNLPKNEYLLEKSTKKSLLLGMIDILFGYAYDQRVNEGDASSESGWNIRKLSATLSWFDSFSSLKQVVVSCVRRSLCYPLYRDWNLSIKVLEDVIDILNLGHNYVLKCFLDINKLFNESGDGKYILNDLYITDYCVWLQYVKPTTFKSLASALNSVIISKADVDLELDVLERAAQLAINEHNDHKNESVALKSDSSDKSESLMHQTSSECSSNTSETTFSSSEVEETTTKIVLKKDDIDSDDDCPQNICDDTSSHGNDSDDELSS